MMKEDDFSSIETNDAFHKLNLYLSKITKANNTNSRQVQKICHLAVQTCLKFCDKEQFTQKLTEHIKRMICEQKNYFLLYLYDMLIKNSRSIMILAKKDLDIVFKLVWQNCWTDNKNRNSHKLEGLKAMARTWGIIYGQKLQQSLKTWIFTKYKANLNLETKHEEMFNQLIQKLKNKVEGNNLNKISGSQKHKQVKQKEKEQKQQKNIKEKVQI